MSKNLNKYYNGIKIRKNLLFDTIIYNWTEKNLVQPYLRGKEREQSFGGG
jgi:hypothetical protein